EGAAPALPAPPPHPRQTPGETHPPAPPRKPVGRWRSGREGQTKGGNEGVPPTPVPPVPPRTTASPVAGCSAPRLPAAGEASPPPLREWGHPSPARGNLPGRGGFPSPPHRRQRAFRRRCEPTSEVPPSPGHFRPPRWRRWPRGRGRTAPSSNGRGGGGSGRRCPPTAPRRRRGTRPAPDTAAFPDRWRPTGTHPP